MSEKLKLVDPSWMPWRVLRRDFVTESRGRLADRLSWHPLNFLQAPFLNYHGVYNIKPDGWVNVPKESFVEVYFNQPRPPGFSYTRWEKVTRPK